MKPLTFRLQPLDLAQHRASLGDLVARWADVWAEQTGHARLISHVHPISYSSQRQALRQRATALEPLRAAGDPAAWAWGSLLNQEYMYAKLEETAPPLGVTHYATFWPESQTQGDILRQTLRSAFLLPEVEPAALPAFVPGRYRERARYLEPLDEGAPFMTVVAGHEAIGRWDPRSWMDLLLGDLPLALCLDIETLEPSTARSRITRVYNQLYHVVRGPQSIKDSQSEATFETAERVLDALGRERLHLVRYLVLIPAETLEELWTRVELVRTTLGGKLHLDLLAGSVRERAKYFSTTAPAAISRQLAPIGYGTLSTGVAAKLPFGVRKRVGAAGVCLGLNTLNLPVVIDPWRSAQGNVHMVYMGITGGGKTTSMLVEAHRFATAPHDPAKIVFLDPLGKGRLLTKAIGPEGAASYEVAGDAAVNPLDVVSLQIADQAMAVRRKLSMILGDVEIRGGESTLTPRVFSALEWPVLDLALQRLYGERGERLALMRDGRMATPLLRDLVRELYAVLDAEQDLPEDARRLALTLGLFLRTSQARRFDAPTALRWDFSHDVTAFSLEGIGREMRPLFYTLAFEVLDDYVRTRRRDQPFIAVVDEYRYLAQVRDVREYAGNAVRTWRNLDAAIWTGVQNPGALMEGVGSDGHSLLTLAQYKLLFRLGMGDISVVQQLYGEVLSDEDARILRTANPDDGECLTIIGDTDVEHMFVALTNLERRRYLTGRAYDAANLVGIDQHAGAGLLAAQ
jgi:hypothetical protein